VAQRIQLAGILPLQVAVPKQDGRRVC
jgi:hypothetical protein